MTKIAFISDTHTQHKKLTQSLSLMRPDIVVHSGDFTADEQKDKVFEIREFADWGKTLLRKGYTKRVVCIAGNHDLWFDRTYRCERMRDDPGLPERSRNALTESGLIYLEDSSVEIFGLTFYGSPWTGRFYDWAFQIDSAEQDAEIFGRIPEKVDVLITHGPPLGIRDTVYRGPFGVRTESAGSPALRAALDRVRPRVHAFGHIHHTYGMTITSKGTVCVNACTFNAEGKPKNPPIYLNLET